MDGKMPSRGGREEDSKSMQILIDAFMHGSILSAYASIICYFSYSQCIDCNIFHYYYKIIDGHKYGQVHNYGNLHRFEWKWFIITY